MLDIEERVIKTVFGHKLEQPVVEDAPQYQDEVEPKESEKPMSENKIQCILDQVRYGLEIILKRGESVVGQSIILYSDYLSHCYTPQPILYLNDLVQCIFKVTEYEKFEPNQYTVQILAIVELLMYLIVVLVHNPVSMQMIMESKRKNAIYELLFNKKSGSQNQYKTELMDLFVNI